MTLNIERRMILSEQVAAAVSAEPTMAVEQILTLVLDVPRSHAQSFARSQIAREVARRRNGQVRSKQDAISQG